MKNTIGILLLFLLLLIGTCIYQKTNTLYALDHSDANTTKKQEKQLHPVQTSNAKEVQEKQDTPIKPVQLLTEATIVQEEVAKVEEKETSILEKIKASVISALTSDEQKDAEVEPKIQATLLKTTENKKQVAQSKLDTKLKEKEVVKYLLKVLEERDTTLTQRDEAESKLQALIKTVLQERKVAIETMEEQAALSEKEHKERLKKRDETAKAIYQKYTENKGK